MVGDGRWSCAYRKNSAAVTPGCSKIHLRVSTSKPLPKHGILKCTEVLFISLVSSFSTCRDSQHIRLLLCDRLPHHDTELTHNQAEAVHSTPPVLLRHSSSATCRRPLRPHSTLRCAQQTCLVTQKREPRMRSRDNNLIYDLELSARLR